MRDLRRATITKREGTMTRRRLDVPDPECASGLGSRLLDYRAHASMSGVPVVRCPAGRMPERTQSRLARARRRSWPHPVVAPRADHDRTMSRASRWPGPTAAATRGPTDGHRSSATPSSCEGVLYATSPQLKVFALDARNGRDSAGSSTRSPRSTDQTFARREPRGGRTGKAATISASSSRPDSGFMRSTRRPARRSPPSVQGAA